LLVAELALGVHVAVDDEAEPAIGEPYPCVY